VTRLGREEEASVASYFESLLQRPVSLDLWTRRESPIIRSDRDPCTHCDNTLELARQLASLHPAVSLTLYDLDKHAARAEEAGIERPPVTVIRCGGRELRFVGLWSGALFQPFLSALVFASAGTAPVKDETREALAELSNDLTVEVMVAPYDPLSAHLMLMTFAFAVESPRLSVQVTEIVEFPLLAASRAVTEVPVLLVNGRRYGGAWEEDDLVEQLRRAAAGDDSPVVRARALSAPYMTEEEARAAMEAQAAEQPVPPVDRLTFPVDR